METIREGVRIAGRGWLVSAGYRQEDGEYVISDPAATLQVIRDVWSDMISLSVRHAISKTEMDPILEGAYLRASLERAFLEGDELMLKLIKMELNNG